MSLSNTFTTIFDKAISNGHAREYDNKWIVEELGEGANNDPFGSDCRW